MSLNHPPLSTFRFLESLRLFVNRMLLTKTTVFLKLELIRSVSLILCG